MARHRASQPVNVIDELPLALHGGPEHSEPFLTQQLVDAVDVFLPVSDPSARADRLPRCLLAFGSAL